MNGMVVHASVVGSKVNVIHRGFEDDRIEFVGRILAVSCSGIKGLPRYTIMSLDDGSVIVIDPACIEGEKTFRFINDPEGGKPFKKEK